MSQKRAELENFKAFSELQQIPLRPLTLIYGANSAGKSSILHGLLLSKHASETGELDVHRTNIGGDAVDRS
ncbi:MAG: AAA family ATPase [Desulfobacteraceae bacterium]